ncbi:MAG: hypothetical protein M9962_11485 [Oligoflexia bacterium]|nr:hypothetical protein [Oligoflexia bacterium]
MKFQRLKIISLSTLLCSALLVISCSSMSNQNTDREVASSGKDRGSPGAYDPGPEKDSSWAELFASTPNYRGIGDAVIGGSGEKFRWVFGPMWYRGRLGKDEVKVFVVGQEGAQDENVSNRAFTGSTGTKTQNFLNHLGIRYSYIFLNTFVYTINGQLSDDPKFKWLEQGVGSPIVDYRHKLFDNVAKMNQNSLALLMGVGSGGKASLMSWIKYHGGVCRSYNPESCDLTAIEKKFNLKKKLFAIGVPHPGGANPNLGGTGQLQKIIAGFDKAAKLVFEKAKNDSSWMPEDYMDISGRGAKARRGSKYRYSNAPVPHWDFAFGTNWRMGKDGTSSNRQGADSIQVFSDDGEYNPPRGKFSYVDLYEPKSFNGFTDSGKPIAELMDYTADGGQYVGDLPYESPKYIPSKPDRVNWYDYGPCGEYTNTCDLSELLMGQKSGYQWPDFKRLGVTSHESFGTGPIYRGRLQKAKVIVLADQMSHDDFFSTRALTGDAGQKLQSFLYALGLTESYAIIRTLPVDTLDLSDSEREAVIMDPQVVKVRNKIFEEVLNNSSPQAIVSFGRFARKALESANKSRVPVFHLDEVTDGHASQWNEVFNGMKQFVRGDVQAMSKYSGRNSTINRSDLPAHTRWWMGTTGDRARRAINKSSKKPDPDHYMITAPYWVKKLRPIRASVKVPSGLPTFLGDEVEASDEPSEE